VENGEQQYCHGAGEVQGPGGVGQHGGRIAHVGIHAADRTPAGACCQQGTGVRQHHRVVVHVHDPRVRCDGLRGLMRAARRRQPGADIEKLADPCLGGEVLDHPGQEGAVGPRPGHHLRAVIHDLFGHLAVSREMILAAQPVPVHPRRVGHRRVERGTERGRLAALTCGATD
jgi:hypothetical protein